MLRFLFYALVRRNALMCPHDPRPEPRPPLSQSNAYAVASLLAMRRPCVPIIAYLLLSGLKLYEGAIPN